MWNRVFILLVSAALLVVSSAEAVSGHCSKTAAITPSAEMSAHCAEMMEMQPASDMPDETRMDAGACCCVITSAPVLFETPFLATPTIGTAIWSRPMNIAGQSVPVQVAIPPPRI